MFNTESQLNPVRNPLVDSIYTTCSIEGTVNPPPIDVLFWITNLGNQVIDNNLSYMVFGGAVPPPSSDLWVDNLNDYMVDDLGNYLIFSN